MREQREKNETQLQDRLQKKIERDKGGRGIGGGCECHGIEKKKENVQKSPLNKSLYFTPPSGTKTYCKKNTNSEIINLNTVVSESREMEGSRD